MSAVRPVSTGSVSIAEAIAKAKSIAADRGAAYQSQAREDPRLAGRPYRNSRSRSRSPPRRDAFRDNYNPYRDERRDDRRGAGGYGRDRSPSPQRGAGSFSPQGRPARGGGGGGGGGDGDSETISVNSALVGLIIGRQGENLRKVEAETGARVQFIPAKEPNAANRMCTISGPARARESAKQEIFRIVEENGGGGGPAPDARGGRQREPKQTSQPPLREGENSRQILVPDKTVGLIIGRGGETIRDLQERSACHVNIVGENKSINGKRPVNLIGSEQAAAVAEAMIWEIVESDTRSQGQGGQAPRAGGAGGPRGYDPYGGGGGGGDKITDLLMVPSEAVGMIIGKGGETIKQMQNDTGCKINVNQPTGSDIERQIDLVGSHDSIARARAAIGEKVDTVVSHTAISFTVTITNMDKLQRDSQGGRHGGGGGRGGREPAYDPYSQPQQTPYGQPGQPQGMPGMPGMGGMPQGAPAMAGDPNAADPYAPYGGYQAYVALWYSAMAAQGQPPQQ